MAAISAMAEDPNRVNDIFVSTGYEEAGIYAMNMYALGVPFTQIVDDYLPVTPNGNTIFAAVGHDGSYWAAVMEKMFAKYFGNYEHLVGGWMTQAVSALNGSPSDSMDT